MIQDKGLIYAIFGSGWFSTIAASWTVGEATAVAAAVVSALSFMAGLLWKAATDRQRVEGRLVNGDQRMDRIERKVDRLCALAERSLLRDEQQDRDVEER